MRFVELAEAHLDVIAAIEAEANEDPWSRSLFAGELDLHAAARHWLVAVDDTDQPQAFGGLMFVEAANEAHLMNIAVAPDAQRQGLASRLLIGLMREARSRGTEAVTLEVRFDNAPARALYDAFGFEAAGLRQNYYSSGAHALVMWAHNIQSDDYGMRLEQLASRHSQVHQ